MALSQSPRNRFGEARSTLSAPSTEARHYRREADAYGQAYRLLRREGRRGNLNAALEAPNLLQRAAAQGHTPGGIRSSETFRADTANFENEMGTRTAAREGRINRLMGEEEAETGSDRPVAEVAEARSMGAPSGPANPMRNRLYSAIDILEGSNTMRAEGNGSLSPRSAEGFNTYNRGLEAARDMGVTEDQVSRLTGSGDTKLRYRQLLDRALGEATSPEEVESLKKRGVESGITPEAFDRRSAFWSNRRRLS